MYKTVNYTEKNSQCKDVASRYYDELGSKLQGVQAQPLRWDEKLKKLEETIQRVARNTTRKQANKKWFDKSGDQVWTSETLPRHWTERVLCPVYKRGGKLDCKNYRGICLLNVTYKVFAKFYTACSYPTLTRPSSITRLGSNPANQQQPNSLH
jgi:hypothetical protein